MLVAVLTELLLRERIRYIKAVSQSTGLSMWKTLLHRRILAIFRLPRS